MQNGLFLVTERHIPQFQYRGKRRQVGFWREYRL